jgi:uncharacterized membrane protein
VRQSYRRGPRGPGIVLGIGLGGLADGIVLHQILQWHHVLSSTPRHPATTVRGLEANTLWDGWFHAASWVLVVVGVALLWRRGQIRGRARALLGWVLVGWGLFNIVEGVVDHHILGIHHVRPGPDQLAYDIAFLCVGAALIAGGWLLARGRGVV